MVEGKCWVNNHAHVLKVREDEGVTTEYVFYSVEHRNILPFIKGSTRSKLNQEQLRQIPVPLPSLVEQQSIAKVFQTIDRAIQQTDEIIAKTQRLKQGLMQELLTKGIGHKEFKETEIGTIPNDWDVVSLDEALEICQYGLSIPLAESGRFPIIRMNEIIDGYVTENIAKFVDLDEDTFQKYRLERGDILFNRTNSLELVGRTGLFELTGDYVFASYLIRLRPKKSVLDSHFLTYQMIFSRERLIHYATKAVHQANINATNLRKVMFPLPPLEEQVRIVDILRNTDDTIRTETEELERLKRVKQGFMDLLLTGKVRVRAN
jgi:type I restriction enzyme S subunit